MGVTNQLLTGMIFQVGVDGNFCSFLASGSSMFRIEFPLRLLQEISPNCSVGLDGKMPCATGYLCFKYLDLLGKSQNFCIFFKRKWWCKAFAEHAASIQISSGLYICFFATQETSQQAHLGVCWKNLIGSTCWRNTSKTMAYRMWIPHGNGTNPRLQ